MFRYVNKCFKLLEHDQQAVQTAFLTKMLIKALCFSTIPHIGIVTYLIVYAAATVQHEYYDR